MGRLIDIPVENLTIEEMLLRLEPVIEGVKTIEGLLPLKQATLSLSRIAD